jgi:uracil-DNA glycosylase
MNPEHLSISSEEKELCLQELALACAGCQHCGLYIGRTQSVFADGNPHARVMLIGEGPGYNEDISGKPFVGKAGKLLDQILASVGFDRAKNIYIANVVKCRPPNNRTPSQEEMSACVVYLEEQINLVQPLIIILAGLTGQKQSITKARGNWLEWNGIWCMPIFHPAYLLRNDSREVGAPKWQTWQDVKKIAQKYKELNQVNS